MADWPFMFSVVPQIPERLQGLRDIAYNLWWSWNDKAPQLWQRLDPELWESCEHSPSRMLRKITQGTLSDAANNPEICALYDDVMQAYHAYMSKGNRWFANTYPEQRDNYQIAYFSAEFGFHESLPIYSGGLGILAGDHCKAASDLGLPFCAVGLLYRRGYFRQQINKDGWQESASIEWDFNELPITECKVDGDPNKNVVISVNILGRDVFAKVWEVKVGLISVFLLDCDIPENHHDEDRKITYQLYGGDHEMRIRQEMILGIGGVRALRALGKRPAVHHLNEGHAAFLSMERIRQHVVEDGLTWHQGLQHVAASNVFTTHTPVPAGNDAFSPELMHKYFDSFVSQCNITFDSFLKLGRSWNHGAHDPFSMTILALRTARQSNGVSAIHGGVSREMWKPVWPGVPRDEVPIDHVTNGIHTLTWMAPEIRALFEKAGGAFWDDSLSDAESWKCHTNFTDQELWETHQQLKGKLVDYVRHNVRKHRLRSGYGAEQIREAETLLDPNILTIGFARRFATYKRATLLLRDLDRLAEIINNSERPIQFLFAGKAHPADDGGKKLIQHIYHISQRPEFKGKIVFVENYDIEVARYLYHGVDVWLNNPTRPLEASGTSGEKVPPNCGLNFSVRDGWWDEAANGNNGWSIGEDVESDNPGIQDEFDSVSIYSILEHQIAPLYYRRDSAGVPSEWIARVRDGFETICPQYNTFRMVQDYTRKFYRSAADYGHRFVENNFAHCHDLAGWKKRIRTHWHEVQARHVTYHTERLQTLSVDEAFRVDCEVKLGELNPAEVLVEVYVRPDDGREKSFCYTLVAEGDAHDGWLKYSGEVYAHDSGSYNFNVRVIPAHPTLIQKHELRLATWAK